jgi:multidrug efflux pump subunit AcrA (membrane-fusion protein)
MKKIILIVVIVGVILSLSIIFIKKNNNEPLKVIDVESVKIDSIKSYLVEQGVIKPQVGAEINIGARATGLIEKMNVKVGDNVKKGQFIAKIDDREIQKQIEQVKEDINIIHKEIELENTVYPYQRNIYLEAIFDAKSKLTTAQGKYERERTLFSKGFSAKEDLDNLKSDFDNSKASLEQNVLELKKYDKEHRLNLEKLDLELKKQQSLLEELEVRLTYTEIYAPIDGVVTQVAAEAGETIVTGLQVASLITVFNPALLELWVYVDETDIGRVVRGQEVEYTIDTYPDKKFYGNIDRIDIQPEILENIVYYKAIVNIPYDVAMVLKPQMSSQVKIVKSIKEKVLTVPNGALKWDKDKYVVYKVIDKKRNIVEKISIMVGERGDEKSEILEGLKQGDIVATKIDISMDK